MWKNVYFGKPKAPWGIKKTSVEKYPKEENNVLFLNWLCFKQMSIHLIAFNWHVKMVTIYGVPCDISMCVDIVCRSYQDKQTYLSRTFIIFIVGIFKTLSSIIFHILEEYTVHCYYPQRSDCNRTSKLLTQVIPEKQKATSHVSQCEDNGAKCAIPAHTLSNDKKHKANFFKIQRVKKCNHRK